MTAQIIDGKQTAAKVREDLARRIAADDSEEMPVLAVVLVGENEASRIYVRNKKKAAAEVGIGCEVLEFSDSIGEHALLEAIGELNDNPHVNGIIVQLPLPEHINPLRVLSNIRPEKDVDGFNPYNAGLLACREPDAVVSATPRGILKLLETTGIELAGKHAVVIGRSNIVGRPAAMLLLNRDCTVSITHSKTENLPAIVRQADIVIAACGQAGLVKKEWIKEGAAVIDVGINRVNGKLCGDVDFEGVSEKAAFITPVPGGVGPMTVAMLLENTYEAFRKQRFAGQAHECRCGSHGCGCSHH
ncbi:MAG: bifunctional methylenetetrahydrofolate dehydrogenase/methenyltetrahydrofolate cyclohydrolase FolD [Alphaproteobacteria bacterium]|nr:bifunctional methylenetetrahydrofolate dehydrogenase/methenyltetrahydrofolate cyclohydrolase FolD [Alphaproteobacteria bacterium]